MTEEQRCGLCDKFTGSGQKWGGGRGGSVREEYGNCFAPIPPTIRIDYGALPIPDCARMDLHVDRGWVGAETDGHRCPCFVAREGE
jgi:hypothetical protein